MGDFSRSPIENQPYPLGLAHIICIGEIVP